MSDSESDAFIADSGSDDYMQSSEPKKVPVKKAPAKPKAAAAKAPAKKAPAKKPLASKKNPPNDSISENESDDSEMLKKVEPDAGPSKPAPAGKPKDASDKYQKIDHCLKRPDSYIGSVQAVTTPMWVYDPDQKIMVHREITYVPGFFKIFDEILVNAADNKVNDPSMSIIKVVIDRVKNQISVHNDGKGIPVEMHKKEGIMIPELIFGHLLTSSNYDDDQEKLTGGRNGYGAKLANIFSHEFIVETADKVNSKKYKQVFKNNMSSKDKPKITENPKGEEWTRITFTPDLARFKMDNIDDDTYALLCKRVYDMAGTVNGIRVQLNDEKLKIKGFKQYVEMYVNSAVQAPGPDGTAPEKPQIIYEQVNDRWEVAFALSDGEPRHVSFANSISTSKGGTHVEMISTQLASKLGELLAKKHKNVKVKPFQIKNYMWIFVNALIVNPTFDSQTKECLTLAKSSFGSKCELKEDFIKKVAKTPILERVLDFAKFKQNQALKKTDGAKRMRITGIAKLEDANSAGGRNGKNCTLIITEGDSAKALAVSGLGVVGRDEYGVFPIRGKLLNVREANHDQIMKNVEIQNIKQILGLKHNFNYTNAESLRYGHLMIMTDQDHDGSHIKGLLINFLDHFYPSLLKIPGFLVEFITPIVKVTKGKQEHTFYTMPQYEEWKEENNDGRGWDTKYYKGLGTSTSQDAKKYFGDLKRHKLPFGTMDVEDRKLIDMAFSKKKADDRKEWLRQFKPGTFLDHDVDEIPIADFVNKELILFSMADNIRSIPSVADGLKPGQRKVLFGAFKKKIAKEIKVAQLVGYISEQTAYHHGEQSLTSTIVGLAQNFVGSNNINLLSPNGQFGTRISGGKDAASARYIFTAIPRMTRAIFHPADDPLMRQQVEDGMNIEPEYYLPTIPMVLVNGADGIGTGWSTSIPNYNPVDIVENLRRMMKGEEPERMNPWFRGFKGSIERVEADKFVVSGVVEKIDDNTIEVTELPIRKWTEDFKKSLEEMMVSTDKTPASIKEYYEHHTDTTVHFKIILSDKDMKAAEAEGLEKRFKLTTSLGTGNMVCFDLNGKIKKYASAEDILQDFFHKRLEYYGLRKQHLADELDKQFDKLSNQARFVQMIISKELVVSGKKKAALVAELRGLKFRPFPKSGKSKDQDVEAEPAMEEEEEGLASDYDYLLGMAIWSLTTEKVDKLLAERDAKEQELIALLKLTPQDIWNADLDNFLVEWELLLDEDVTAAKMAKPKTKTAIKAAAKKLKRMNGSDSDESDDFKPTAAKKKAAVAKVKVEKKPDVGKSKASPVKRPSAAVSEDSDNDKPAAKKAATKASKVADDSDDEYLKPTKQSKLDFKPAPKPTKAKPKAASTSTSKKTTPAGSDSDAPVKPRAKAAPRAAAKAPPRKKKAMSESEDELGDSESASDPELDDDEDDEEDAVDDDDEDDFEMDIDSPPPAKKAPARKAPAASKKAVPKKVVEAESDQDPFEADSPPKKKTAAPAPAKKAKAKKDESDSDGFEIDSDGPSPAAVAAKKAAPVKKAVSAPVVAKKPKDVKKKKDESDAESDYDVSMMDESFSLPAPKATTARPGRGAAKKPAAYIDLSDEED